MINLTILIIIPIIFIGLILIISGNTTIIRKVETNSLRHMVYLEENHSMISYVVRKYFSKIIKKNLNFIPSLLTVSFWHENMIWQKLKESKDKSELLAIILKKIGLCLSLMLFLLIGLFWF